MIRAKRPSKPTKVKRAATLWTITKADTEFSKWIRARDKHCVRCGRIDLLQNSHFFSRQFTAVRFDAENCDTLCYPCHYGNSKGWEYEKNGAYQDFKRSQLGKKKYEALVKRHAIVTKRSDAIVRCMALLSTTSPLDAKR